MSVTIQDPIFHDITVYQGTDGIWYFRRVDDEGVPYIPDGAWAEMRDKPNGKLWAAFRCIIDPVTGWIEMRFHHDLEMTMP